MNVTMTFEDKGDLNSALEVDLTEQDEILIRINAMGIAPAKIAEVQNLKLVTIMDRGQVLELYRGLGRWLGYDD